MPTVSLYQFHQNTLELHPFWLNLSYFIENHPDQMTILVPDQKQIQWTLAQLSDLYPNQAHLPTVLTIPQYILQLCNQPTPSWFVYQHIFFNIIEDQKTRLPHSIRLHDRCF